MPRKLIPIIVLALSLSGSLVQAQVEQAPRISKLGAIDREFMQQQRQRIDELARFNLGRQLRGEKTHDLDVLQTLLDRRLVGAEQALELQAMGVVMGDLLKEELDMHWVVYEDRYGRSRALQLQQSENFLFPITMISRRAEVGATVDVTAIYRRAVGMIEPYRRPLPFQ